MPRGQKSAIRVLFASGVVCIFIATLRAAQITANTIKTRATMDGTWLAVWGMVETAVGKIIIYALPLPHEKPSDTNIHSCDNRPLPLLRYPHPRNSQE